MKKHTFEIIANPKYILPNHHQDLAAAQKEYHDSILKTFEAHAGDCAAVDAALRDKVIQGLPSTRIRGIYWRKFLGYFPKSSTPETWEKIAAEHRAKYVELLNNASSALRALSTGSLPGGAGADGASGHESHEDLLKFNPLSKSEDNIWRQASNDQTLVNTINLDLIRTNCDQEFFASPTVQQQMLNVLFVWAKLHPEYSYRQGMNDLIAQLLLTLALDSVTDPNKADADAEADETLAGGRKRVAKPDALVNSFLGGDDDDPVAFRSTVATRTENNDADFKSDDITKQLCTLLDRNYVEHDTFVLFSALMEYMGPYFVANANNQKQTSNSSNLNSTSSSNSNAAVAVRTSADRSRGITTANPFTLLPDDKPKSTARPVAEDPPLVKRINAIFYDLLPIYDRHLFQHLKANDVLPTVFLIKWVRLLFSREFKFRDTCMIWDALFAYSENVAMPNDPSKTMVSLPLVEPMCIAMLVYIRETLLEGDNSHCLRRLMRYPPVEHLPSLLAKAAHFLKVKAPVVFDPKPHYPTAPTMVNHSSPSPSPRNPSPTSGQSGNAPLDSISRFFAKVTSKLSDAFGSNDQQPGRPRPQQTTPRSADSHTRTQTPSFPSFNSSSSSSSSSSSRTSAPSQRQTQPPVMSTSATAATLTIERLEARITRLEEALAAVSFTLADTIEGLQVEWEAGLAAERKTRFEVPSEEAKPDSGAGEQKQISEATSTEQQAAESEVVYRPISSKALLAALTSLVAVKEECDRLKVPESRAQAHMHAQAQAISSPATMPNSGPRSANPHSESKSASGSHSSSASGAGGAAAKPIFFAPQKVNTFWQEEPSILAKSKDVTAPPAAPLAVASLFEDDPIPIVAPIIKVSPSPAAAQSTSASSVAPLPIINVPPVPPAASTTTPAPTKPLLDELEAVDSVFDSSPSAKSTGASATAASAATAAKKKDEKSATLSARSQAALKELFGEDDPLATFTKPSTKSSATFDGLFD